MATSKVGSRNKAKEKKNSLGTEELPQVLTLTDAAAYLRVSEEDVAELAARGELPGRKIKDQWRFHKEALSRWLCSRSIKERLLQHAGAAKDDPYLDQMLEKIYRDRGRPISEDEG